MSVVCFHIPRFAAWSMGQRWRADDESGRGVVICSGGLVFSFSPALGKRGIAAGESVARARALAPDAEFLLRDHAIETAVRDSVLARLYTLTPQILALGEQAIGECTIDSAWILLGNPDIDRLQSLAEKIGAQVGIASHRSWAMLAALHSEPGHTTSVPFSMIEPFLRQAPVALLERLGFDRNLIERLELFGLKAIGLLLHLTERHLNAQFGSEGNKLFDFLHPPESDPPVPNYNTLVVEASFDFEWPVFEPRDVQPVLRMLLERLLCQLRGRSARHIEIRLTGRHGRMREANRLLKDPCHRSELLFRAADSLLRQALAQRPAKPQKAPSGRAVQSISLILSGITERSLQQAELFERTPKVQTATRSASLRFPGKLVRPIQTHANPFFPEEEYRFEPVAR